MGQGTELTPEEVKALILPFILEIYYFFLSVFLFIFPCLSHTTPPPKKKEKKENNPEKQRIVKESE